MLSLLNVAGPSGFCPNYDCLPAGIGLCYRLPPTNMMRNTI